MPISAPYNFVPLSDKVFTVDWADDITMDIPFVDGEDGVIELTITNHTPLFIGNKKGDGSNGDNLSRHIVLPDGSKHYYIPGTTLKGCFRSVMEILSFAGMDMYNNDSFGYRYVGKKQGGEYSTHIKNATHCGWLRRISNANGDRYEVVPCSKKIQCITHDKLKAYAKKNGLTFDEGADHMTAERKQRSIGTDSDLFPIIQVDNDTYTFCKNEVKYKVPQGQYRIVCTGFMAKKNVEYLFSVDTDNPIDVSNDVFQQFNSVHKNTEYYGGKNGKGGFLKNRLMDGESIPVFFEKDKYGNIVTMGITAYYRYPYKYTVQDMVRRAQKEFEGVDLPHAIFGHIGDHNSRRGKDMVRSAQEEFDGVDLPHASSDHTSNHNSLRGRVSIGNAFATNTHILPLDDISGVLGQPKASFYPLYLKQDESILQKWDSETTQIAGRKRYRIIKGLQTLMLPKGNGNEKMGASISPIPANNTFKCKIRVHNLRKMEIGALLSAITFNQTNGTYHNLGMAKSFGYGIVSCHIDKLDGLNHSVEEYIKEFNRQISLFLQEHNSSLSKEKSLDMLVSIASATHTSAEMRTMEMEEFEPYKEINNKSSLSETIIPFNIPLNEQTLIHEQLVKDAKLEKDQLFADVASLCADSKWDEAIAKLEGLKIKYINLGLDPNDIKTRIEEVSAEKQSSELKLAEAQNQERYNQLINEAQTFLSQKEYPKAKESATQALNLSPENTDAQALLQQIEAAARETIANAGIASVVNKPHVKSFDKLLKEMEGWMKKTKNPTLPESQFDTLAEVLVRLKATPDRKEKGQWESFDSRIWKTVSKWLGNDTAAKNIFDKVNS